MLSNSRFFLRLINQERPSLSFIDDLLRGKGTLKDMDHKRWQESASDRPYTKYMHIKFKKNMSEGSPRKPMRLVCRTTLENAELVSAKTRKKRIQKIMQN